MEEYENGHKTQEETHEKEPKSALGNDFNEPESEAPEENEDFDVTTELADGNEVESEEQRYRASVFAAAEPEDNVLLSSSNKNPKVSSDISTYPDMVSGENVPVKNDYVEDEHRTAADMENRQLNQPLISENPSLVQRTSWECCCGLFQFLRRSND